MNFKRTTFPPSNFGYLLLVSIFIMLNLFCFTPPVRAATVCSMRGDSPAITTTATLNNVTYVGNELPIGSIIYQASLNSGGFMGAVNCTQNVSGMVGSFIANSPPLGASYSLNGIPVFPTNVDGVGVAFSTSPQGAYFSEEMPGTSFMTVPNNTTWGSSSAEFRIQLIKTGNIATGSTVDASLFPSVKVIYNTTNGVVVTGLPLTVWNANVIGSVSFLSTTCETPNVNVDMGTYGVSGNFDHTGATTPWIDSSIILKGCPTFSGRHATLSTRQSAYGSVTATGTNSVATLLTVSLTPASSIIDTANGVIEVDAAGSSGAAATGVGLQLGYTPNNINATATSPSTIWMPGMSWDVQPPNDGRASFKIPLAARYYQTSNTVTPGPANARVTFNIDYK